MTNTEFDLESDKYINLDQAYLETIATLGWLQRDLIEWEKEHPDVLPWTNEGYEAFFRQLNENYARLAATHTPIFNAEPFD